METRTCIILYTEPEADPVDFHEVINALEVGDKSHDEILTPLGIHSICNEIPMGLTDDQLNTYTRGLLYESTGGNWSTYHLWWQN